MDMCLSLGGFYFDSLVDIIFLFANYREKEKVTRLDRFRVSDSFLLTTNESRKKVLSFTNLSTYIFNKKKNFLYFLLLLIIVYINFRVLLLRDSDSFVFFFFFFCLEKCSHAHKDNAKVVWRYQKNDFNCSLFVSVCLKLS